MGIAAPSAPAHSTSAHAPPATQTRETHIALNARKHLAASTSACTDVGGTGDIHSPESSNSSSSPLRSSGSAEHGADDERSSGAHRLTARALTPGCAYEATARC